MVVLTSMVYAGSLIADRHVAKLTFTELGILIVEPGFALAVDTASSRLPGPLQELLLTVISWGYADTKSTLVRSANAHMRPNHLGPSWRLFTGIRSTPKVVFTVFMFNLFARKKVRVA